MAGHQVVGMLPAWQRLDAPEPGRDVLVLAGDVEAELVWRVIEIGDERKIRDRGAVADDIGASGEPLVENRKRVVDAALEEGEHDRVARRPGEGAQKAIGPEITVDLLIVEDDPAQRLELVVLVFGPELARTAGEIAETYARLAEFF